jgi:prepilin peptidase CpaA
MTWWLLSFSMTLAIIATGEDLWRRRVSNVITGPAFLIGLSLNVILASSSDLGYLSGLGNSLLGGLIGFVAFLPFFLKGGMGGGDIKLMAAFGAILGREQIILAAILAAISGGLMAVLYLLGRKVWRGVKGKSLEPAATPDLKAYIPYAPAISIGVFLSFLSEDEIWTSVS